MKGWDWCFEPSSLYHQNSAGDFETIVFNDGSINDIIEGMLSVVVPHVMPIFEKGIDCKSALDEVKNYEASVFDEKTCMINDSRRYWWYIKIGDYVTAIKGISAILDDMSFNIYSRQNQVGIREKRLQYIKLDYEIGMSDDYRQTKKTVLSREDIDSEYKRTLLSRDMFFENYKLSRFPSMAMNDITKLKNEIEQLMDTSSPLSKDLRIQETEHEKRKHPKVNFFSNLIDKLSIPDVGYFQNLIAQNEAISYEYLKHPR